MSRWSLRLFLVVTNRYMMRSFALSTLCLSFLSAVCSGMPLVEAKETPICSLQSLYSFCEVRDLLTILGPMASIVEYTKQFMPLSALPWWHCRLGMYVKRRRCGSVAG